MKIAIVTSECLYFGNIDINNHVIRLECSHENYSDLENYTSRHNAVLCLSYNIRTFPFLESVLTPHDSMSIEFKKKQKILMNMFIADEYITIKNIFFSSSFVVNCSKLL